MARFSYRARSASGEPVSGILDGESAGAVASRLIDLGITPIEISPATESAAGSLRSLWRLLARERTTLDDLLLFSRQMHALVRSGVPLIRGLQGLRDSTRNEAMRQVLDSILESLAAGQDLAGSFARHPEVFPPMYISLIRVGENSGTLEKSFQFLHQYIGLERRTRNQIKSALRYPTIVIVAIMAAMAVLTLFVIPAFGRLYHHLGNKLPLPTRIIFAVSMFASHYWWVILGIAGLAAWWVWSWKRTPKGQLVWDRYKLRLPVVGGILERAAIGRFARTFAIIQRAGVPLVQGITLVAESVGNAYLGRRLLGIRDGIERGASIAVTAAATNLFPGLVLQMIQVGEETGALDDMLDEVGMFYEEEVDYDLARLSSLLEPILLGFLAVVVLILALGVYLPIWDLYKLAQH